MAYRDTILAESTLVNYYELSADGADSKGTNTGTVAGGVTFGAGGVAGNCATFNGSTGKVTAGRTVQDDFTLECWFKTTASAGSVGFASFNGVGLISSNVSGFVTKFGLALADVGRLYAGTCDASNSYEIHSPATAYNDGAWHHVCFTRVKSTGALTLWVDGASVATGTGTTQSLTASTAITLGDSPNGGAFFGGSLDEVALYSSALTSAQVLNHYGAATAPPAYPALLLFA